MKALPKIVARNSAGGWHNPGQAATEGGSIAPSCLSAFRGVRVEPEEARKPDRPPQRVPTRRMSSRVRRGRVRPSLTPFSQGNRCGSRLKGSSQTGCGSAAGLPTVRRLPHLLPADFGGGLSPI